jgi:hypothetical protein
MLVLVLGQREGELGFGRSPGRGVSFFQVIKNSVDHLGFGDESNDPKVASAATLERIGVVNPLDKLCPTLAKCSTLFRR